MLLKHITSSSSYKLAKEIHSIQTTQSSFCLAGPTKPVVIEEVYIPDLDGTTYLELPTLPNVGQEFVIELWFLSRSREGVLLYNGQESLGRGDFVALNLVGGKVQFLYDLGSGMANIT